MLLAILFTWISAVPGTTALGAPQHRSISPVDSIVVDPLVKSVPNRVPMPKQRRIGRGDLLTLAVRRLQQGGFFELTPEAIANACGQELSPTNRVSIRVHDDGGWHGIVIPDTCNAPSAELTKRLSEIRSVGWDVLAGHVGGAHRRRPMTHS
jgi:hypothetical protein